MPPAFKKIRHMYPSVAPTHVPVSLHDELAVNGFDVAVMEPRWKGFHSRTTLKFCKLTQPWRAKEFLQGLHGAMAMVGRRGHPQLRVYTQPRLGMTKIEQIRNACVECMRFCTCRRLQTTQIDCSLAAHSSRYG
ncbi:hypothetical protein PIB30_064834 [Stylosanthes scabra]|uniref:Uncharacterized protein n=1 Tax=Stylosanthes scabra TaxID=79078 RepID=A0ABU6QLD2_9FABA|nr:hypothetical protein [Stylosanthes scabra]